LVSAVHEPVNPRHADVGQRDHFVAHHLGRHLRFFRYGQIAGARAHDGDFAFPEYVAIAPEAQRPGGREELAAGVFF
jgi:hypothetical protein